MSRSETSASGSGGSSYPILDPGALAVGVLVTAMVAPVFAWVRLAPSNLATPPATFQLLMLAASALLTLAIAVVEIFVHIRTFGGPAVRGNRDNYPAGGGFNARIERAHANAVENLVPFAAVVLSVTAMGIHNPWTSAAAALFLVSRLLHALTYAAGVTVLRSAAYYAGVFATVLIALQLPWISAFDGR
jgi:uncharacterized MAPEG superfamily protein